MSSTVIGEWLDAHARDRGLDRAVLEGDRATSWAGLDALSNGLAERVTGHDTVALLAAPSTSAIAVVHAALRGGFKLVPINARAALPEIARLIETSGASILFANRGRVAGLAAELSIEVAALEDVAAGDPARPTDRAITPAELLVPTSGTTGTPRLARLTPANLEASAVAWSAVLGPTSAWLLTLGLAHVAGIGIVVRAARDGVPIVIPGATDSGALLGAIERAHRAGIEVSHLSLVAIQLSRLLDEVRDGPPPPSIRAVLLGGGPIPATLVTRATGAGWPVIPTYGLTETASGVTALAASDAAAHPASSGRPLPGVDLRTDARSELHVRGPLVFAGYARDDAATAAALGDDGWLRTGDVATIDGDGFVQVVDRLDDLIISGGENVAPAEVEAALLEHPGVADAGVIGVPDATWGRVPVAVVVPCPGIDLDADVLLAFARSRLASFKVPSRIVVADALPRSEGGKLLRRELGPLVATGPRSAASGPPPVRLAVVDVPGPAGAPTVVLLHATLASSASLSGLGAELAGDARVIAMDRRGSGRTPLMPTEPVTIATHVADLVQALDDAGVRDPAVIVGHSFGGVVGLELAARHPGRVAALIAWEPPYLALADGATRERFAGLAAGIAAAHASGGAPAAAETFYTAVNGARSWNALPTRLRTSIGLAGDGALADAAMPDLDPAGLGRIAAPVVIATGGRGDPLYAPIADALVARIPTAHRVDIAGLEHMAPMSDPRPIARLVRDVLTGLDPRSPRDDR